MNKHKGLQVKPGRYVIAVPREWRISMDTYDPDMVCAHVARETFGKRAILVGLNDEIYAEAVAMLEQVCESADRDFDLIDPVEMIATIDSGHKYIRVVDVRKIK